MGRSAVDALGARWAWARDAPFVAAMLELGRWCVRAALTYLVRERWKCQQSWMRGRRWPMRTGQIRSSSGVLACGGWCSVRREVCGGCVVPGGSIPVVDLACTPGSVRAAGYRRRRGAGGLWVSLHPAGAGCDARVLKLQ
ncbi:hypothetical protein VPH35_139322 [Triticum aestivum]